MSSGSFKNVVNKMFTNHFFFFFLIFIIKCVKACVIPCPHHPPTRGDNTVLVGQSGTATPGTTKQLLPLDRVLRELCIYVCVYVCVCVYIYIYARSIKSRDYIGR